ncbi:NAD(P)/FAD-dependent oxidoreductase [Streptomyces sp. NPDC058401]|uniref:NAD(P)/FAD-dependent oxidoreductase n=1 Tax=Streptomyces sp. NPDC058401 TaxID=3346480 RepID=UPI0036485D0C
MSADLVVVGAGIIGAFVAHEASLRHPDWDILVLERGAVGGGTTAWSAGASFPIVPTTAHRELVRQSKERFATLEDTAAGAFQRPVPMIYLTHRDRIASFQARLAVPLRGLDKAERERLDELFPDLRVGADERFVTHDGDGSVVQARPMAEAVLTAAMARGSVRVQTCQRVGAVSRLADGYQVTTDHAEWHARKAVLAVGPWDLPTVDAAPEWGLLGGEGARRKRVAALHSTLPVRRGDPLVYFLDDDLFVLPLADGAALVSFRSETWDLSPGQVDGSADEDDLRDGTAALAARSAVAAASVVGGRAFCDLYTHDRLPLVRVSPAAPGLAAVVGGSGSGVRLSPGLAAQALDAITTTARRAVPTG